MQRATGPRLLRNSPGQRDPNPQSIDLCIVRRMSVCREIPEQLNAAEKELLALLRRREDVDE